MLEQMENRLGASEQLNQDQAGLLQQVTEADKEARAKLDESLKCNLARRDELVSELKTVADTTMIDKMRSTIAELEKEVKEAKEPQRHQMMQGPHHHHQMPLWMVERERLPNMCCNLRGGCGPRH